MTYIQINDGRSCQSVRQGDRRLVTKMICDRCVTHVQTASEAIVDWSRCRWRWKWYRDVTSEAVKTENDCWPAAARPLTKGAITSKTKHAIKHKTSPARLAQLLHNCCSPHWHFVLACSQWRYAVTGCKLKQNANEGCNSCASLAGLVLRFIACFVLLVIAP